jgi:hypothetical protein
MDRQGDDAISPCSAASHADRRAVAHRHDADGAMIRSIEMACLAQMAGLGQPIPDRRWFVLNCAETSGAAAWKT